MTACNQVTADTHANTLSAPHLAWPWFEGRLATRNRMPGSVLLQCQLGGIQMRIGGLRGLLHKAVQLLDRAIRAGQLMARLGGGGLIKAMVCIASKAWHTSIIRRHQGSIHP